MVVWNKCIFRGFESCSVVVSSHLLNFPKLKIDHHIHITLCLATYVCLNVLLQRLSENVKTLSHSAFYDFIFKCVLTSYCSFQRAFLSFIQSGGHNQWALSLFKNRINNLSQFWSCSLWIYTHISDFKQMFQDVWFIF